MITRTTILILVVLISCNHQTPRGVYGSDNILSADLPDDPPVAKNVIFLIGDGMGVGQVTAGMYLNNNKTILESFPVVGFHKSHSADNLITDSAAGATAFACGIKTYNGAIGVSPVGQPRESILEEAERKGKATGMIVTSTITHATPAAFAAHVPNRRLYEDIALDYMRIDIDLLIGGGKAYFTRRDDNRNLYENMRKRNYYVTDYFETPFDDVEVPGGVNFAYFTADKDPLPVIQGRDYFIPSVEFGLEFLNNRNSEGFFAMIEGSQIDWGGHANDLNYVISEFAEFDDVIRLCYEFARQDGQTLVIVTGDHETGGLTIKDNSTMKDLHVDFSTGGHTAVMIPVFAYGPGAEHFGGIYDNTEIHKKLRQAFGWKK